MKKILALSALLFAGFAGSAHAVTVDVLLGPPGSGTVTVTTGLPIGPLIDTPINQFTTLIGGTVSGGILTLGNGGPFGTGQATYNIIPIPPHLLSPNQFSFQWLNPSDGAAIAVNTADANGAFLGSYNVTGAQIIGAAGGVGVPIQVVIVDPNTVLVQATFLSQFGNGVTTGFKADHFAEGPALPLPGSVWLFLTAMLGLMLLSTRRIAVKK